MSKHIERPLFVPLLPEWRERFDVVVPAGESHAGYVRELLRPILEGRFSPKLKNGRVVGFTRISDAELITLPDHPTRGGNRKKT